MPLLLGEITKQEWVESIAIALVDRARISEACARDLGRTLATASSRADGAVVEMLRKVRTQMPLVLVSNATVELEEELASLGLAQLADHVVNSARVGVAKPDRRVYEIAARRAEVAVGRCLFVDDGRANVDAAVALGMTGVHFRQPEDLRAALGPVLGG